MRIIAGEFGSRKLYTLEGKNTRPTLDKVKEAVFSSIGTYFEGGRVLDLYAGSGAIGLEALSRGMKEAVFVDQARDAVGIIKKNITALNLEDCTTVYSLTAKKALDVIEGKFDLVYLDPPYAKQENEEIISLLETRGLLNPNAIIIVESLKEETFSNNIGNINKYKEAVYGISRITYYCYEPKE